MTDEKTFGQLIRELREGKEWTLREAAEKIGEVTFAYLSQLEVGVAKPSEELARRIANVYGTDEEELAFLARRIPEKLQELEEKFPTMMAKYYGRKKRSK